MGPGRARGPTEAPDPGRGDRRPGEMGSLLNGAKTGIRWKRGEEPKLGCTFWGHGKQCVDDGGSQQSWGAGRRAPRRGKGTSPGAERAPRGASTCRQAGRAAQVRKRGRERSGQRGPRTGAGDRRGPEGRRAPQGRPRHRSAGRRARRGVASGRAAGRREPLTCAAEAELQQPMAGPEEPGGGAGRAATPRSPSACEPPGARGGRGLAPHDSAATAATATAARSQEAARFGAGAGHIPRRWWRRRRLRGSGSAPAAAAAPQRKGAGGGGGTSPWPPPPTTRAQSLSRSLSRAAAAASSSSAPPRASPIRLPAPSAAPRRADGGATAARTRPGPWARAGACAAPGPFRGGTEAAVLPRGERASEAGAPEDPAGPQPKGSRLASRPARHAEGPRGCSLSRLGTPPGSLTRSFLGLWWMLILPSRKRAC